MTHVCKGSESVVTEIDCLTKNLITLELFESAYHLRDRIRLLSAEKGYYLRCRKGRNGIGRREKWGRKCREEGDNEMLGVGRDG